MSGPAGGLRIAYLLLRPPSYSETFIEAEIRAVRAAGATVEVFVTGGDGGGRIGEAGRVARALLRHPVRTVALVRTLGLRYGPRAWLAAAYALRVAPRVARFGPDVVHTHFVNLPTAVTVLVGRLLGRPATAMAHAADLLLERDRTSLDRRLRRLGHLFVISGATVRQLTVRGVSMARVPHTVVRAAFDGAVTATGRPPRSGTGVRKLVTVARLVAKKGVGTAIDAVADLVAAGQQVRYDVYGDGPLRADLRRQVAARGLDRVVTLHGAVPHQVATAALADADVAVLPCQLAPDGDLDGIPVFLMEAGGRGVPVVTTPVSGIPELVDPASGWLVPPADPAALADAIGQVLADPQRAAGRATALAERIRTEFTPARQADRLLAVWRDLAGPPASTTAAPPTGTAAAPPTGTAAAPPTGTAAAPPTGTAAPPAGGAAGPGRGGPGGWS
ncbi:glycosyltransferase [Solwaraspora sp. WMMD1047]|uniref:glycosyltransferase n=1 Tax=Solwaraspora sp. WMMD1047 TaxID=3016102 RepID=UPI00241703AD|nr:glycosyltransferase [Solwaraspora sp. WMMD1047]MDG4829854.1 glycosyltransferase [Solwaraspora sp. WMMD1047]